MDEMKYTIADLTRELGLPDDEQSAVAAWTGLARDVMVDSDGWKPCLTGADLAEHVKIWKAGNNG